MKECVLVVKGHPVPEGRITIDDDGGLGWKFVPINANGGVVGGRAQQAGHDCKLLNQKGATWGKLINFSLYSYNEKIEYTLISGKTSYKCKVEVDDFELNT